MTAAESSPSRQARMRNGFPETLAACQPARKRITEYVCMFGYTSSPCGSCLTIPYHTIPYHIPTSDRPYSTLRSFGFSYSPLPLSLSLSVVLFLFHPATVSSLLLYQFHYVYMANMSVCMFCFTGLYLLSH